MQSGKLHCPRNIDLPPGRTHMYITLADIESTVRAHQAGLGQDAEEVSIGARQRPDES